MESEAWLAGRAGRETWPEIQGMMEVGRMLHGRGWSLATSSNYSVRLSQDPFRLLLTKSGMDKGRLTPADFVVVDEHGRPLPGEPRPSAETMLHVVAAQRSSIGAVLHTHSVWGTLLSDVYHSLGHVRLHGYEMIKALDGVSTHDHELEIPIYENTQDIGSLAEEIAERFEDDTKPKMHGFLIRRHGLYTWGRDLDEARRHVEGFEFLLEVAGRALTLRSALPAGLVAPPVSL
ncbi:MAG: methylthioribulose 1-phosphate dehydratase [Candidatus Hydrogenedens sp.]|nr:methylthioribulose 1-phosphate dehydratase [Candidatus Hydrogenedens sp.]